MPSDLPENSAPPASLDHLKARAAPTQPGAGPEQLGSSAWTQERASGCAQAEDLQLSSARKLQLVAALEVCAGRAEPAHEAPPLGFDAFVGCVACCGALKYSAEHGGTELPMLHKAAAGLANLLGFLDEEGVAKAVLSSRPLLPDSPTLGAATQLQAAIRGRGVRRQHAVNVRMAVTIQVRFRGLRLRARLRQARDAQLALEAAMQRDVTQKKKGSVTLKIEKSKRSEGRYAGSCAGESKGKRSSLGGSSSCAPPHPAHARAHAHPHRGGRAPHTAASCVPIRLSLQRQGTQQIPRRTRW